MSLKSTWELINNEGFKGRVIVAAYKASVDICNGPDRKDSSRYKLAISTKFIPKNYIDDYIWAVASNPSVSATAEAQGVEGVPDGDIEYVIATVWDDVAKLKYPEPEPQFTEPEVIEVQPLPYIPPPEPVDADGNPVVELLPLGEKVLEKDESNES